MYVYTYLAITWDGSQGILNTRYNICMYIYIDI